MPRDGPIGHRGGSPEEESANRAGIMSEPNQSSACTCATETVTGVKPSDELRDTQSSCPVHKQFLKVDQKASFVSKAKTPVTPLLLAHDKESSPSEPDGIRRAKAVPLPKARARIVLVSASCKSDRAMSVEQGGASRSLTRSSSEDRLSNLSNPDPKSLPRINSDLKISGTSTPQMIHDAELTASPTEIVDGSSALAVRDRIANPAHVNALLSATDYTELRSTARHLNASAPAGSDDDDGPAPVVGEKPSYFRP